MLYWYWLFALWFVQIAISYRLFRGDIGEHAFGLLSIIGAFVGMAALAVSWPILGTEVYSWLDAVLPQQGELIHELTIPVLLFALGTIVFFLVFAIGALINFRPRTLAHS